MEEYDDQRKKIIRRISLLTWGLVAGAVVLAVLGGAMLAWFFQGAGFPFRRTWLIISLLLLLVPAIVHLSPWPRKRDDGAGD